LTMGRREVHARVSQATDADVASRVVPSSPLMSWTIIDAESISSARQPSVLHNELEVLLVMKQVLAAELTRRKLRDLVRT
jgi:hypothetical protein